MPDGRRHLGLDDRRFIEASLAGGTSFTFMARRLGVAETTVSREVKRNMVEEDARRGGSRTCENEWRCEARGLCDPACAGLCRECGKVNCAKVCPEYVRRQCPRIARKPYVCNGCAAVQHGAECGFARRFYDAARAQAMSEARLSNARSGIDLTSDELVRMVEVVKPLLAKGQSLEHIWATHPGEFPVTSRTFYTYVEDGLLDICNMDLPKKVRYKKRRRKRAEPSLNPIYDGRRYGDFNLLPAEARARAVEMDCVEGRQRDKKVILTMLFRHCNFQAMRLLPRHTRLCVQEALDGLERAIGLETFRDRLGLILTDHGHEFNNFIDLEKSCTAPGEKRCTIYYCDPMRSDQKGGCERNHVVLRQILPKGTSVDALDGEAVSLACSHINSYARPILGNRAPFDILAEEMPAEFFEFIGAARIEPEDIVLKPSLLSRWLET